MLYGKVLVYLALAPVYILEEHTANAIVTESGSDSYTSGRTIALCLAFVRHVVESCFHCSLPWSPSLIPLCLRRGEILTPRRLDKLVMHKSLLYLLEEDSCPPCQIHPPQKIQCLNQPKHQSLSMVLTHAIYLATQSQRCTKMVHWLALIWWHPTSVCTP